MGSENAAMVKDTTHNTLVQELGDLQDQRRSAGSHNIANQMANLNLGSDMGDGTMDFAIAEMTLQDAEETREGTRTSPKRPQIICVDKPGNQSHERTRSITRRMANKNAKTWSKNHTHPIPPLSHPPKVDHGNFKNSHNQYQCDKTRTRLGMFEDYIRRNHFDIIFALEITDPDIVNLGGYVTHLNIGTTMHGTAIVVGSEILLTNVTTLPSGCAIAAEYRGKNW